MRRIAGLNTLRFFAFFSIFLFHTEIPFNYGYLGVDFFFVLSSFLLTYLAYKELEKTNVFSKRNFFIRRALRIFPLYFLVIFSSFFLLPIVANLFNQTISLPENKLLYYLLLSNYETSDSIFYLKFLWSISVEEQFYLLFILLSFLFRKHILILLSILLSSYIFFMFYASINNISTYSHTITHFSNFLVGIFAGYIYFKKIQLKYYINALFLISSVVLLFITNEILFNLNISVFFASLILIFIKYTPQIKDNKLFLLTEEIGVYTYGLYIYSGIVLTFIPKILIIENSIIEVSIEFIVTLLIAILSYHLWEKHFLKLKKYFQ